MVSIAVSLATRPRPDNELRGLVYALTERPHPSAAWYLARHGRNQSALGHALFTGACIDGNHSRAQGEQTSPSRG